MRLDPRRLGRLLLELLLLVAIVGGVQAWRGRDMLPADRRTAAPDFQLVDLEGRPWTSASLAGRPAVLYFFAPWCSVCAASSPQLRWFHRWRGEEVQLVMVGLDWSTTRELSEYAAEHELPVPVLAGDAATAAAYQVLGYPSYYVVDSQGRLAARDFGFTTVVGLWLRTLGL